MPVKAKRSTFNYTLPITLNKAVPQAANVTDLPPEGPAGGRSANITRYQLKDSSCKFRYGTLPPHRQMFYQLCDLDVDRTTTQHTSRLCNGYLTKKGSDGVLHQMTWTPQSPDLNHIEMVWDELDCRVKQKQPTSAQHMWELLQGCWKSIRHEAG
uniref:Tc1-like transposase DDE domain-containing protein n=1 Tax=Oncorhynchus tshawytscha TaxID=74940 RepID=A0A8C8D755_ONCTS